MSKNQKDPGVAAINPAGEESTEKQARSGRQRRPIDILRERHGGPTPEMKEYFKTQNTVRKQIIEALQKGPKTIPEIARTYQLASNLVLWHLMAMRRYGKVIEDEMYGDYYSYRLKEV